eukprot:6213130-Pleurochrysis_carterae.AAC.1
MSKTADHTAPHSGRGAPSAAERTLPATRTGFAAAVASDCAAEWTLPSGIPLWHTIVPRSRLYLASSMAYISHCVKASVLSMAILFCHIAANTSNIAIASFNYADRAGSGRRMDLGRDNLKIVSCFLLFVSIGVFAQCSNAARQNARSEAMWKAQLGALTDEYSDLSGSFALNKNTAWNRSCNRLYLCNSNRGTVVAQNLQL